MAGSLVAPPAAPVANGKDDAAAPVKASSPAQPLRTRAAPAADPDPDSPVRVTKAPLKVNPALLRGFDASKLGYREALLYAVLIRATWGMLEIVHDERSPILQVPGSVTYVCVLIGMVLMAALALLAAWRAWHSERVVHDSLEPGAQAAQG